MQPNEPAPAVALRDVHFSYESRPVLESVNLSIPRGRFVCFVGPNGGGKTTLFRLLLGLIKPIRGTIQILGGEPESTRPQLGYVPQHFAFDPLFPVRVFDVVRMGCLGGPERLGRAQVRQRVAEALGVVGLGALETQWFNRLSGGQRQRVLIARALAAQPAMLLLDEPTSNVDAGAENEILGLLEQLHGALTVLLVTHNAAVASRFLEMIVCVNRQVHVHPATDRIDDRLMRHICGYEAPGSLGNGEGARNA